MLTNYGIIKNKLQYTNVEATPGGQYGTDGTGLPGDATTSTD